MPYSRITRTPNGADAIIYAYNGTSEDEKGHNDHQTRNELITGINLIPGVPVISQFEKVWMHARQNHKWQMLRIILSFSLKELNPEDPNDIAKGHQIGLELAKKYPNRQILVFTQIDGESGLVHDHILVSDCDINDYKGCEKYQINLNNIRKWNDEISSKYFKLDYGSKQGSYTRTERVKRNKKQYCWKDDIRTRVAIAMNDCISVEDFIAKCKDNGIIAEKGHYNRTGKDNFLYTLNDYSKIPADAKLPKGYRKYQIRSYRLGDEYDYDALMDHINNLNPDISMISDSDDEISTYVEPYLECCCNDFYNYAVNNTTEKKNRKTTFPANDYLDQLNKTLSDNQMQIDLIIGMMAVMDLLKSKDDEPVYNEMLYDLIDKQRALEQEKLKESIEASKNQSIRIVKPNPKKTTDQCLKDIEEALKNIRENNDNSFKL